MARRAELLAPAGGPEAGYAAFRYGADAVYLGLERFSARAEAVNFTPDSLDGFVAYAHTLIPRRNVYLALNTLIKEDELAGAAETLLTAAACGVDAVIVQDLGVAALVKRHFPRLRLHASTQLAIHNLDGARAARDLGFARVTLARELTLREVERIASESGIEAEVFIHGALCYSYSGLCLFSSLLSGRSGNRGRCSYPCREAARCGGSAPAVHPFSLKDLALGPRVLDLVGAGAASLKIEGRKKSPLYVAATVDYYRRILDGGFDPADSGAVAVTEAALQTIFARPWTKLFLDGTFNPDAVDMETVGHRGAPLGVVEGARRGRGGTELVFVANLGIELHDGIQIDFPGESRPLGFPVDELRRQAGGWRKVFAAPPGSRVAVTIPNGFPVPAPGQALYLASSQAVKRSFPCDAPKKGVCARREGVDFTVSYAGAPADAEGMSCAVTAEARTRIPAAYDGPAASGEDGSGARVVVRASAVCRAFPARDAGGAESTAKAAFHRFGDGAFRAGDWSFSNPDGLFVKPGALNSLRRRLLAELSGAVAFRKAALTEAFLVRATGFAPGPPAAHGGEPSWGLCVDDPACLGGFTADDLRAAEEVAVGVGTADLDPFRSSLDSLAEVCGRDRIRLLLPLIVRDRTKQRTERSISRLVADGWRKWLVPGLGAFGALRGRSRLDLVADWPLYVLNHLSAEYFRQLGFSGITLSPEDDRANYAAVLAANADWPGTIWIVAYSDLPLFVSAACAHSHLGLCASGRGRGDTVACREKPLSLMLESGWRGELAPFACGSVVTGDKPYSLLDETADLARLGGKRLRIDLRWRRYRPGRALEIWRRARTGAAIPSHSGNYRRGLA